MKDKIQMDRIYIDKEMCQRRIIQFLKSFRFLVVCSNKIAG